MSQPGLEFDTPRSHNTDPPSSHRAEARCRASGAMGSHRAIVLALVRRRPGYTATNYARLLAGDGSISENAYERGCQIRKRLSDLRKAGLVERVSTPGADEVRWFPVGE